MCCKLVTTLTQRALSCATRYMLNGSLPFSLLLLLDESDQVKSVNHRLISRWSLGWSEGVNNCQFMFQNQTPSPPWLRCRLGLPWRTLTGWFCPRNFWIRALSHDQWRICTGRSNGTKKRKWNMNTTMISYILLFAWLESRVFVSCWRVTLYCSCCPLTWISPGVCWFWRGHHFNSIFFILFVCLSMECEKKCLIAWMMKNIFLPG